MQVRNIQPMELYKVCEIVWSGPTRATVDGTRNSAHLNSKLINLWPVNNL